MKGVNEVLKKLVAKKKHMRYSSVFNSGVNSSSVSCNFKSTEETFLCNRDPKRKSTGGGRGDIEQLND